MSVSLSGWGHPEFGCEDNSDKVKDANTSNTDNPCGEEYSYYDFDFDQEKWITEIGKATWEWFHCKKTEKCIPFQLRCDSHPHPSCIYNDDNNKTYAEDEENCSKKKVFLSHEKCQNRNFSFNFNARKIKHFIS